MENTIHEMRVESKTSFFDLTTLRIAVPIGLTLVGSGCCFYALVVSNGPICLIGFAFLGCSALVGYLLLKDL